VLAMTQFLPFIAGLVLGVNMGALVLGLCRFRKGHA